VALEGAFRLVGAWGVGACAAALLRGVLVEGWRVEGRATHALSGFHVDWCCDAAFEAESCNGDGECVSHAGLDAMGWSKMGDVD
jgi:hypothetical protein